MFNIKQPLVVTVSRTACLNYQSKSQGFTVEVPKGVSITEVLDLLDFMIEARLARHNVGHMCKTTYHDTYRAVFGEELADFLKLCGKQEDVLTAPKTGKRNLSKDED